MIDLKVVMYAQALGVIWIATGTSLKCKDKILSSPA